MLQQAMRSSVVAKHDADASVVVKQGADASAAPAAVVKQGARSTAAPAAASRSKRKYRLKKSELRTIIALRPELFLEDDYVDDLAEFFPPEWIEKKKRQQVEDAAYFGKIDEEFEDFRQQVIQGVRKNGFFEVDEEFLEGREEANERARQEWAKIDFSELRLAAARPNQIKRTVGDGYIPYVPNEDDALLDDIPSDDDFMSGYEEDDALLSDKEDLQGERAEAQKFVPPTESSYERD